MIARLAFRLPLDIEVAFQNWSSMKKIEAIGIASEMGVANEAPWSPEDALGGILTRHSPALYRVAAGRPRNAEDAEDTGQGARVTNVVSCKDSQKGYAVPLEGVSGCGNVVPANFVYRIASRFRTLEAVCNAGAEGRDGSRPASR